MRRRPCAARPAGVDPRSCAARARTADSPSARETARRAPRCSTAGKRPSRRRRSAPAGWRRTARGSAPAAARARRPRDRMDRSRRRSGTNSRSTLPVAAINASSASSVRGYAAKSSLGPNCVGLTKMLMTTRCAPPRRRARRGSCAPRADCPSSARKRSARRPRATRRRPHGPRSRCSLRYGCRCHGANPPLARASARAHCEKQCSSAG